MLRVLVTWVGKTDLRAPTDSDAVGIGPIAQALELRPFDEALLLADSSKAEMEPFVRWLGARTTAQLHVLYEKLSRPH